METSIIKTKEIQDIIWARVILQNTDEAVDKFGTWFSSELMSAELPYDLLSSNEIFEYQKSAEAFAEKVEYMFGQTFGGKCNMDSIYRMLVRICDKGLKLIPDLRLENMIEDMFYGDRKNGIYNSHRMPGGYKRFLAHFRWNRRTYILHSEHIKKLSEIIKDTRYFEFNDNPQMCSLEEV